MDSALDSPGACIAELSEINRELAEFGHEWSKLAGELKRLEREYDSMYRTAMRGIEGRNAEERQAAAHAAVEKVAEGVSARIATLDGLVEDHKTRFKSLERRASIVQSILAAMREESKIANYVHG